jgi:hypothetical protein
MEAWLNKYVKLTKIGHKMKEIGKKIEKKIKWEPLARPPVLEKKRSDGNFMQGIKLSV